MSKRIDHTGSTFGRLTIICEAPRRAKSPNTVWHAQCVCGNVIEAYAHNLVSLKTQSCGCFKLERQAECEPRRIAAVKARWAKYRLDKAQAELVAAHPGIDDRSTLIDPWGWTREEQIQFLMSGQVKPKS